MTFPEWWADIGQRTQAFTAEQWCSAGWAGHTIHGTTLATEVLDDEQKLLEDNDIRDRAPDSVTATWGNVTDTWIRESDGTVTFVRGSRAKNLDNELLEYEKESL